MKTLKLVGSSRFLTNMAISGVLITKIMIVILILLNVALLILQALSLFNFSSLEAALVVGVPFVLMMFSNVSVLLVFIHRVSQVVY